MKDKMLVFEMDWKEKLINFGILVFLIIVFFIPFMLIRIEIFFIVLGIESIIIAICFYQMFFISDMKIVIFRSTLIYYRKGKECYRTKITKDNIKTYYKERRIFGYKGRRHKYIIKYMLINDVEIPISMLGLKNRREFEKVVYEIQNEKIKK